MLLVEAIHSMPHGPLHVTELIDTAQAVQFYMQAIVPIVVQNVNMSFYGVQ